MLLKSQWTKPVFTLSVLITLIWLLPSTPVDPWNLLNLKKVATMIFALAFIQILGSLLAHFIGARAGAILTGFLGGLISSTATTATLAKQSKHLSHDKSPLETVTFLCATLAMLLEGASLLLVGTNQINYSLFLIFIGPVLATVVMVWLESQKIKDQSVIVEHSAFKLFTILKLSAFIVFILILSKLAQNYFGQNGLSILTFFVSLFEIHGSLIANIQLYEAQVFDVRALGHLLTISITASYISKLFLIITLGRVDLKKKILKRTFILGIALTASWALFVMVNYWL